MKNPKIFNEYSPEKLYFLIKKIIISNKIYKKNYNNFLFVNGWNNWKDGSYLEPDNKYGYASINALSKALFKLNFRKNNINLLNLSNIVKINFILLKKIYKFFSYICYF